VAAALLSLQSLRDTVLVQVVTWVWSAALVSVAEERLQGGCDRGMKDMSDQAMQVLEGHAKELDCSLEGMESQGQWRRAFGGFAV
jgi:hypothetical protein